MKEYLIELAEMRIIHLDVAHGICMSVQVFHPNTVVNPTELALLKAYFPEADFWLTKDGCLRYKGSMTIA